MSCPIPGSRPTRVAGLRGWVPVSLALIVLLVLPGAALADAGAAAGDDPDHADAMAHDSEGGDGGHPAHSSAISDEYIPLQLEGFPERPKFLLEIGNPYLGTGNIKPGLKLFTGAIWQPTLIMFGTLRTAIQSFEAGDVRVTEWANRLDLFFNLQLSGTERLVIGFRPLDQDGQFSGYIFEPSTDDPAFEALFGDTDPWRNAFNTELQSLFFEGDFGEIFPTIGEQDFARTDVGFSIGRQPLIFQDAMLIADTIDGLGITRNTLMPRNTSNFRMTFFAGAGDVHRANVRDKDAQLYGIFTSTDVRRSTIDADLAYVHGSEVTGDLLAGGASSVQRIGKINTTFRLLGSYAVNDETPESTDGALLFSEVSYTPHYGHNLVYFNSFVAVDEYSRAASGPSAGGPLGRAGINFAAVGLGNYGAPLSSRARDVAGGAVGYQKFFGALARRQIIGEVGLRVGTAPEVADQAAATVRYQMAFGRRLVLVWDGFVSYYEGLGTAEDETGLGGRFELVLKF